MNRIGRTLATLVLAAAPLFSSTPAVAGSGRTDVQYYSAVEVLDLVDLNGEYSYLGPVHTKEAEKIHKEKHYRFINLFSDYFHGFSREKQVEFYRLAMDRLMDANEFCECDELNKECRGAYHTYGEQVLVHLRSIASAYNVDGIAQEALAGDNYESFLDGLVKHGGACGRDAKVILTVAFGKDFGE